MAPARLPSRTDAAAGVAWGDAWVRSPDCAAVPTRAHERVARRLSLRRSCAGFARRRIRSAQTLMDFSERAFQMGRRPDGAWATEALVRLLRPAQGLRQSARADFRRGPALSSDDRNSSDAFALRRGTTPRRRPRSAGTTRCAFRRCCRMRGVAGAWTFASRDLFQPTRDLTAPALRTARSSTSTATRWRLRPSLRAERARRRRIRRTLRATAVEEPLFAGPLRTIIPWRWDWFDAAGTKSD